MNDAQVSSAERDISHVHGSVPASLGSMRTLRRNEFITPRSPFYSEVNFFTSDGLFWSDGLRRTVP
jgi:hypothetical protein